MTTAQLGFSIDSSQAVSARGNLERMTDASAKAEAAAKMLAQAMATALRPIAGILEKIEQNTAKMAAGTQRSGAAVQALGNISATASGKLNGMRVSADKVTIDLREMGGAATAAATATDHLAQEMTESSVAAQRQEAAIDGVAAAQGRAAATANATATATRAVGMSAGMARMHSRQLAFQLIDMGQAIPLAFQSPIYALQNMGFQIAHIGQLYMGKGGMKAALTDSISMVGRFTAKMGPALLAVGAVGAAFAGLTYEINRASDVQVGFGDVALATFQIVRDGISSLLAPAIAAIAPMFAEQWNIFIRDIRTAGNQIIGVFVGAYEFVVSAWSNLPAALSGFAKSAVNEIIAIMNDPLLTMGDTTIIPGLGLSPFDISGAEQRAMSGAKGAFNAGSSRDYMGELFGGIQSRAIANAKSGLEEVEDAASGANEALGRAANDNVSGWNELSDSMGGARDVFGGFFDDLRNGLRNGEGFWESFANAATRALDRIIDKLMNQALDGLFGGGGFGSIFSGLFGGGGALPPVTLGGLYANGGAFHHGNVIPFANGGIVSRPTVFPMSNGAGLMGEAGPEAIMPLKRGPGGRLGVEMNGGGGITVNMPAINIDARGADPAGLARVEREVQTLRREMPNMAVAAVNDAEHRRMRA